MNKGNSKTPSENENEKLIMMTLQTDFFKRYLENHLASSNRINKPLAQALNNVLDVISKIIETAEIAEESERESDRNRAIETHIRPAIENGVLLPRTAVFCNACKLDVNKTSVSKLIAHFLSNHKHLVNLRHYAANASDENVHSFHNNGQITESDNEEGSTQSLDELATENHRTEQQQQRKEQPAHKQRLNSLPARIRDVVPHGRMPKRMSQFLITTDLENFTNHLLKIGQRVADQRKHIRVCEMLRRKLSSKYPNVKPHPFGSFGIGLGDEKSDLDIFVDIEENFYKKFPKRKMKDAIFNIQRILSTVPHEWSEFSPVTKARTPILRVFCRAESIDCDLSFSNGLSTCNTAMVAYFTSIQPMCKKLIMFVKNWSSMLNFGVNGYLWTLMVIFYLQQEHALPPIKSLQDVVQPLLIENWNVAFSTPSLLQLRAPLLTNFRQSLAGFFRFYGHQFDYNNYIICTLTGTRVPKHIFDLGKEQQLPPVFKCYAEYMRRIDLEEANEIDDLFANFKPLVVQDPFELIHNVGKGVQEQKLMKIIHHMRGTLEILTNAQN